MNTNARPTEAHTPTHTYDDFARLIQTALRTAREAGYRQAAYVHGESFPADRHQAAQAKADEAAVAMWHAFYDLGASK